MFAPPVALSSGPLGVVQAADREIARLTAVRARAVAEFAAARPASVDRPQGQRGAMSPERWAARADVLRGVSEWAAQELSVALSLSPQAAEALLERSLTLVHRLPGTLAGLEAGALHPGHLWPLLEKVAPIEDPAVRAEVEAGLLRWAAGRVTTPAQLGAKARREVARRDARAAARGLEAAIRRRGVQLRPGPVEGMAAVTALLTEPEGRVLVAALGEYADALPDDPQNPRTRGQKMADCLLDLVVRPGENGLPPVQVLLTVVASLGALAGGDEPGEVDGQVVPAAMIRELLRLLTPSPPAQAGCETHLPAPDVELAPWQQLEQAALEGWWAEMERRVLAEELGRQPEPMPDQSSPCWLPADPEPPQWAACDDPACVHQPPEWASAEWESSEWATPEWETSEWDGDGNGPSDAEGWWARADRAVEAAGGVLQQGERALARAGRLVLAASAADADDEDAWRAARGRVDDAEDALAVLRGCSAEQRNVLSDLLAMSGGGGLLERPRIALTDALTGALLALTDLPGLRRAGCCGARACRRHPERCTHDLTGRPGLGPPGPTAGYRPGVGLDRWVRARDRRCRFPGCRRPVPRGGELDHDRPYPDGPTSAANLAGYCTGHHRGKHQAPGWRHTLHPDGTLTVTSPTGLTATTTPPPY